MLNHPVYSVVTSERWTEARRKRRLALTALLSDNGPSRTEPNTPAVPSRNPPATTAF